MEERVGLSKAVGLHLLSCSLTRQRRSVLRDSSGSSGCPVGSGPEPRATSTIASNSWNASSSPGEAREDGPEGLDKGLDNDAEGVWSPDIEQSFQEALAIYPPCGRRKIILSDEGKMYGRNELIARYIKLRTGKTRTRKQVLARKKVREYQVGIKDQVSKDKALQSMASMSSAQIVSASVLQNKFSPPSPLPQAVFSTSSRVRWSWEVGLGFGAAPLSWDSSLDPLRSYEPLAPLPSAAASVPVWQDRTIASSRLRLLEYSAFMEVQRDPDTADLNSTIQEGPGAFYGVSSQYSSADSMTISVSTKVCSFGKQVVEKVETEYARLENGRFVYRIHRSPMCEYMINFIHKLKHLPEKYMMNSVLENFTVLQVRRRRGAPGHRGHGGGSGAPGHRGLEAGKIQAARPGPVPGPPEKPPCGQRFPGAGPGSKTGWRVRSEDGVPAPGEDPWPRDNGQQKDLHLVVNPWGTPFSSVVFPTSVSLAWSGSSPHPDLGLLVIPPRHPGPSASSRRPWLCDRSLVRQASLLRVGAPPGAGPRKNLREVSAPQAGGCSLGAAGFQPASMPGKPLAFELSGADTAGTSEWGERCGAMGLWRVGTVALNSF
ncbi:hypothetical protein Celaphus_00014229 [Cervus elaphus hippelaphus]|uniref:TEA domain-containing protein n=1 Tax=Cervus elaphus hippelaphus TaxID=46360 RepID=A0A212D5V9_CEREH|nr:hypothetical protein Celaphus_00014229 [Cervus elaphus hippelaphus]